MNTNGKEPVASTLSPQQDPMGAAILDYYTNGKANKLRVLSSMFEEDVMPIKHLFRTEKEMPPLEKKALSMAKGRVLDVGAGAGCHALTLQNKGFEVTAIDISPLSCQVMTQRGITHVSCINLFDRRLHDKFDTILLLMNGTGIAEKLDKLLLLLNRLASLLNDNGQILIDSSDLKYIYTDDDGVAQIDLNGPYYGEVDYQMIYQDIKGESFDWLYVDFNMLQMVCHSCQLDCQLIEKGSHYDYLARITSRPSHA